MYIPRTELQQYRGQFYCPYCVQDLRETTRKEDSHESHHEQVIVKNEQCERCGKELKEVFIWNGKRFCRRCYDDGKALWDTIGSPPDKGGATVPYEAIEQKKKESFVQSIISRVSGDKKAEAKRKSPEIVAMSPGGAMLARPSEKSEKSEKNSESEKKEAPAKRTTPIVKSSAGSAQDKEFGPEIEGLMRDPKNPKSRRKLVD